MLVLSNGELVTVEWVQHEILESPVKVYNFDEFRASFWETVGNSKYADEFSNSNVTLMKQCMEV